MKQQFDVLIIGIGVNSLTLALNLAQKRKVGLITKKQLLDGASSWAQGGIAAVLAGDDTTDSHIRDTQLAGAGLCDEGVTRYVIERGPACIARRIGQGAP